MVRDIQFTDQKVYVMRYIVLSICIVISSLVFAPLSTATGNTGNEELTQQVTQDFERFETLLNQKQDPQQLLEFLHGIIDQDATFEMTVRDYQSKTAQDTKITLHKADFINSYIWGPRQVAGYQADFKTLKVNKTDDKTLTSTAIFTERGRMMDMQDPSKQGQDFISETVCVSTHGIEKAKVTLKGGTCKTDIVYEQAI
ncbi:MAG: hypothetical protein JKY71_08165 [Alphaproteobacteria bacterium]|nr:hypothetical protein [Alphaproteobacteria bacterium]